MEMAKVSVIIPCFNQGQYIDEAVDSVLAQTWNHFEIIVVNDGSTDEYTNNKLEHYRKPNTKVIKTENKGVAIARNHGIAAATGEYILPLDADDKIAETYLEQAVTILQKDPEIGIVYCQAEYFGSKVGKWALPDFTFPEILLKNVIFNSAFFRRRDWKETSGYNPNMKYGFEDFDFWLSLIELERKVYCIPETLFFYRKHLGTRSKAITEEQVIQMKVQLYMNHFELYTNNIEVIFRKLQEQKGLIGSLKQKIRELEQVILESAKRR